MGKIESKNFLARDAYIRDFDSKARTVSEYRKYFKKEFEGRYAENYEEFFSILESIFPSKVEQPYVNLTNLVYQYKKIVDKMKDKNKRLDSSFLFLQSAEHKTRTASNCLEKEQKLMKTILALASSGELNAEVWESLKKLVLSGIKINHERNGLVSASNFEMENNSQKAFIESKNLADLSNELQEVIRGIQMTLEEIKSLDFDSERRIDRIEISRFNKRMDALCASEEKQRAFRRLMKNFTDMRVAAFKVAENFANKIMSDYKKRATTEFPENYQDASFSIMSYALYRGTESFFEMIDLKEQQYEKYSDIAFLHGKKKKSEYIFPYKTNLAMQSVIMHMLKEKLYNGHFSDDDIEMYKDLRTEYGETCFDDFTAFDSLLEFEMAMKIFDMKNIQGLL